MTRPPQHAVAQRDPAETLRLDKPRNSYYDATQLRTDTWVRVRDAAAAMVGVVGGGTSAVPPQIESDIELLRELESYWAFPGVKYVDAILRLIQRGDEEGFKNAASLTGAILRLMLSNVYRRRDVPPLPLEQEHDANDPTRLAGVGDVRPSQHDATSRNDRVGAGGAGGGYFEVLFVDAISSEQEEALVSRMTQMRRPEDQFEYGVVVAPSYEDAIIAALFNPTIQSCVIRYSFPMRSSRSSEVLRRYLANPHNPIAPPLVQATPSTTNIGIELGRALKALRPELDLFLVTDTPLAELAGRLGPEFRRVFYSLEDYREMHLSIIKGIDERFDTPFFDALRDYSRKPTGVFHALPISRGKSVAKSHWIGDMAEFYGENIFLAETSATGGGLDSLLQPSGPLKRAQRAAARAFGAEHTYFATNGTSTANKIVVQSLVRPGDIVLVSRDCHKSHHYTLILAGAHPVYMDPYPISEYSMYGGVPLATIKRHLLALRDAGKLDRVRMLLLTNCTFDGIIYDPLRVMREVLAIKPDMIFVWDEAWFAFATFNPTYRRRTGMWAAAQLQEMFSRPEYRREYAAWRDRFDAAATGDPEAWLRESLLPDPDAARVRVYVTQSTHKTLTALRQGSMIHVRDDEFERAAADAFHEAYMTHTSTSPNYQILASLDVGRRQMELEGYELVQEQIELAMSLRQCIHCHPMLGKYLRLLTTKRLIPEEFRPSGTEYYYDPETGYMRLLEAFAQDEFVLDPSRVSVAVGGTGLEGDAFKRRLIEDFDIQINKTTRNTLLFMTHIGTSRGTVAYLVEVLTQIIRDLDRRIAHQSPMERRLHDTRVKSLTLDLPPLPDFSRFHAAFNVRGDDGGRRGFFEHPSPFSGQTATTTPEGDMRRAFYLAYDDSKCEHLKMDGTIARAIANGRDVVAACFVTPYPPGFPVLVPGQVISMEILSYLKALDVKEIHGYQPDYGLRVFTQDALDAILSEHESRANVPSPSATSIVAAPQHTSPAAASVAASPRDAAHAIKHKPTASHAPQ